MTDSLCMEKHHVKKWIPPPKKWIPPPTGSDPSNYMYITVLKKVTMDSVVDVYPPATEILPLWRVQIKKETFHSKIWFIASKNIRVWNNWQLIYRNMKSIFLSVKKQETERVSRQIPYFFWHLTYFIRRETLRELFKKGTENSKLKDLSVYSN